MDAQRKPPSRLTGSEATGMNNTPVSIEVHDEPGLCEIGVRGHLDGRWAEWLGGLTIAPEKDGSTLLTGLVPDQAALHGLLKRIRDLGLPLLSVNFVSSEQAKPRED